MTEYLLQPRCPKCGMHEPTYEYVTNVISTTTEGAPVYSPGDSFAEALSLTCARCGYKWMMRCLDL